jgi:hypothetical protein
MNQKPEPLYYWLVCKVCHQLHRGDPVNDSRAKPVLQANSEYECPNNRGQYTQYTLDWRIGTESDAQKLCR